MTRYLKCCNRDEWLAEMAPECRLRCNAMSLKTMASLHQGPETNCFETIFAHNLNKDFQIVRSIKVKNYICII